MLDRRPTLLTAILALSLAAGCGDDDDDTPTRDASVADGGGRDASIDGGLDASTDASTDAGPDASISLSLGQVVGVVAAVNAGEISTSQIAVTRGSAQSVKTFAQMMITAHTTAQQRQTTLASQQSITPSDSAVSTAVETAVSALSTTLNATPANTAAFDRLYMGGQVMLHERTLDLIDDTLLPNASGNTALTAELTQSRTEVAAHLAEARQIVEALD